LSIRPAIRRWAILSSLHSPKCFSSSATGWPATPALDQSLRRLLRELAGKYRALVDACLRGEMSWAALIGIVLNTDALYPLDVRRRNATQNGSWLAGQFFPPGATVLPSLVGVSRSSPLLCPADPASDIAFSFGRHRCPGGWFARMAMETAAEAWFATHPGTELAGDAEVWVGDALAAPHRIMVTGLSR
jgi:cytochrome P450